MVTRHVSVLLATGVLLFAFAHAAHAAPPQPAQSPQPDDGLVPQAGQALIIDHTCTDLSKIPSYWIEQARKLTVHYAHTSHGEQILNGLRKLAEIN